MSEIKHQWNGSVLTVISDSGASSADLRGPIGHTGPRGPQGPGGVIYNEEGKVIVDLSNYYLKEEVDGLIDNVDVDLSAYTTKTELTEAIANENLATKEYVSAEIAKAQLEGADIDTSNLVTFEDLEASKVVVDGATITQAADGVISTTLGGSIIPVTVSKIINQPISNYNYIYLSTTPGPLNELPFDQDTVLTIQIKYANGTADTIIGSINEKVFDLDNLFNEFDFQVDKQGLAFIRGIANRMSRTSDNKYSILFHIVPLSTTQYDHMIINEITVAIGVEPAGTYVPVDARFIPIDNETLTIKDGKLTVVSPVLASSEEEYY